MAAIDDVQGTAAAKRVRAWRPGVRETVGTGFVVSPFCSIEFERRCSRSFYLAALYKSQAHDRLLKKKGICNRVLERACRNKPLTEVQKQKNRSNSGTRSIVERVFGVLKLHCGMGKARYLGIAHNKARLALMCLAYNIKRGAAIERSCQIYPQESTV